MSKNKGQFTVNNTSGVRFGAGQKGANNTFKPGNQMTQLRAHSGPLPNKIFRAVQDILENPAFGPNQQASMIEMVFQAINEGLQRRDETGQPDHVTLGYTKLVTDLYYGKDGKPPVDQSNRPFRIAIIADQTRPQDAAGVDKPVQKDDECNQTD